MPDFGGALEKYHSSGIAVEENPPYSGSSQFDVYMTGCRDTEDLLSVSPLASFYGRWISYDALGSADGNIPFVGDAGGAVVWTSDNAEQFRFGNYSNHLPGGVITNWLGDLFLPSSDYGVDFRGIPIALGFTGVNWNNGANFVTNKGAFED